MKFVGFAGLNEAAFKSAVEQFFSQLKFQFLKVDDVNRMGEHIARVAAAQVASGGAIALENEIAHQARGKGQVASVAEAFKDLGELALGGVAHQHLVLNAAEKRFIAEF